MRTALRISICLNFTLLGGLILALANQRRQATAPVAVSSESAPPGLAAPVPASPSSPEVEPQPFHWGQLASARDYRAYIANLRAIGCPEPTVEDIVRGDADRAFSWEREQLGLDGSGDGPWSRAREMQLVASLLGRRSTAAEISALVQSPEHGTPGRGSETAETTVPAQNTGNPARENAGGEVARVQVPSQIGRTPQPAYPLFLQKVNWSALGFTAGQQATIAQVRQQFLNQMNSANQNSSDLPETSAAVANPNPDGPASLAQWQEALQSADDELRGLLGAQGYMAYEQRQYYAWYQPQVLAAQASGEHLTINPDAFSLK